VRAQIVRMLSCEVIHGDLSAYNILAGEAGPTIIDFPQVVSPAHNRSAEGFFLRDFDNVLRFLAGADPALRAFGGDGRKIWSAYTARHLSPDFVPAAPAPEVRRQPPPPQRPASVPARRLPDGRGHRAAPEVEHRISRGKSHVGDARVEPPGGQPSRPQHPPKPAAPPLQAPRAPMSDLTVSAGPRRRRRRRR
jgi:RIO kinase 1